jgi:hypothetical protein
MANLSNINGKFVVEQTTGYVGVGTTDPNFLIEAAGANSEIALNSTSASIYRLRSTSSDSFIITKNGVGDRLVINSAGNATFSGSVTGTTAIFSGSGTILSLNRNAPGTALIELKIANTIEGYLGATTAKSFVVYNEAGSEKAHVENNGNIGLYGSAINFLIGDFAEINFRESGAITIDSDNNQSSRSFQFKDGDGSSLMFIKDTGNIGIGTTSPAEKLEVSGSVKIGNLKIQNADGGRIGFNRNTATGAIYNSNYAAFQINGAYSGADYLEIQNYNSSGVFAGSAVLKNGNFGIGTTSPSYKLQVSSKTRLYNVAIGGTDGGLYNVYSDSVVGFNNLHLGSQGSGAVYVNSALARPMYINPVGGDVGIGTTTPEQRLHVEGRGIFDGGASSDILQIRNDNGGGVFGMTSNLFSLDLASTSNFRIRQGSTTPLYITSAGRVGIGKTNPQAALDISSSYSIQGNVRTYMYAGTATGQTNINLDITVGNEGGQGNVFKIEAGFAHYYAMNYNSIAEWWCTSRGTTVINTYILNASSTLGGAWSASKPSTTVLRITKSAGTYSGSGKYWVKVTYVPF